VNDVSGAEAVLRAEFASLELARSQFPMLTIWGVEDFSETIHSLGINYLSALGRSAGRWAASEYPVRVERATGPSHVRMDTVWWARETKSVELLAEFERYEPNAAKQSLIFDKGRNLLLAHRNLGTGPRLLLLMLWTVTGVVPGRFTELRSLVHNGFRTTDGLTVPGLDQESKFLIATAVFGKSGGTLRLREILA
jgi:hypothetical protein